MQALSLTDLPLFPLYTVLFPGGVIKLRVFEARYVDLVTGCLRTGAPFGVVCLIEGKDMHGRGDPAVRFETVGVLAHVREVNAEQPGILAVRCHGGQRFTLASPRQRSDGLWLAEARLLPDDEPTAVAREHERCARALRIAVVSLAERGQAPVATPHRFDDAGWVANRWCELLPVSIPAKQRLMALDDPMLRLKLIDEYLHGQGVV